MNRAHSIIEVKALANDTGKRLFSGVATTPTPDRTGDIVEPKGAVFKLPIPFLWQHDRMDPIGWITSAKVTDKGIEVEGEVADIEEDGPLKMRLDLAWQMLKAGLVKGLSIGFKPLESARIGETWSYKFMKWEWLELSGVTIAANAEASITAIKSIDDALLAASGQLQQKGFRFARPLPGDSGQKQQTLQTKSLKGVDTMNIAEQIKRLQEMRDAKVNEQLGIQTKASEEGRTKSSEEREQFATLTAEIAQLDEELVDLKALEAVQLVKAVPAVGGTPAAGASSRGALATGAPAIHVKHIVEDKFKGQSYTRMVIAKALAKLEDCSPLDIARARGWDKANPALFEVMKAAVPGGSSDTWGAELVQVNNQFTGDFIEYLYARTIYDQLPLRQIPANVMVKGQDGAATGYWVGESKGIPATTLDFMDVELRPLKVAALAVVSNELLRDSSPAAEMLVRDGLVQASSQRVDTTFLSTTAASSGVSPAGILNGVTAKNSAGNDGDGLRADIKALYADFITARNATGLSLVTTPSLAKSISLMTNALGQTEFPGITATGGTLLGDQVYTGDNVGAGDLILLKPSDIYRIGDTGLEISISRDAMIEQDTVPTGATDTPVAASANMTSMFQTESTAIKVVRSINFAKRRSSAVSYVGDADYGNVSS